MVMGHEDQSLLPFFTEPEEQIHDFPAGFVIQVPGWFVGQNNGRTADDGPGNGHALAFASRELGWEMSQSVGEADLIQGFAGGCLMVFGFLQFQG